MRADDRPIAFGFGELSRSRSSADEIEWRELAWKTCDAGESIPTPTNAKGLPVDAHRLLTTVLLIATVTTAGAAQTVQTDQTVGGRPFLWVEAETALLGADPEGDGFVVVSRETPITSTQGLEILPADSNVSGTALLDLPGGGQHTDTALLLLQFETSGTYQLYIRHSLYDVDGNGNYGNEDSVFLSPAFDHDSSGDWIGFEGLEFDEGVGEIPMPGFALDPDGFLPATGNSDNDGWYAIRDWGVKSEGVPVFDNSASSGFWNGTFHWYNRPAFLQTSSNGTFEDDFGFKTEYVVAPDQVGETLSFEIGTREPYGVFDGFLFIVDDDVDLLDVSSQEELTACILGGVCDPMPLFADGFESGDTTAWSTTSGR